MRYERKGRIKDDFTFLSGNQMHGAFRYREVRKRAEFGFLFCFVLLSAPLSSSVKQGGWTRL